MINEIFLFLAPKDKFVTLNILDRKFSGPSKEDRSTGCVNLYSFSILMDLTAGAELMPAYFLTF
jgi:hypothetical protein